MVVWWCCISRKKGTSNMYQINIVSGDSHCVFKGRMKLEVRQARHSQEGGVHGWLTAWLLWCVQPKAREVKADQLIRSIMLTGTCTVGTTS